MTIYTDCPPNCEVCTYVTGNPKPECTKCSSSYGIVVADKTCKGSVQHNVRKKCMYYLIHILIQWIS